MSNLFDMSQEIKDFIEAVENGDIPEEAINDTLESLNVTFDDKVDGLATGVKILLSEAEAIEAEERNLAQRKQSKRKYALGIKNYLMNAMEDSGKTKIDTPRNLVQISGCKKSVSISNELEFLSHYPMYKVEQKPIAPKVDKTAVYSALKNGEELQGVQLVGGKTLKIK